MERAQRHSEAQRSYRRRRGRRYHEISETKTQAGGTIKEKLADKRAALMDLAKLMGYVDEKKERHIRHLADLSREELEALLADVKAGIKPADPTHH